MPVMGWVCLATFPVRRLTFGRLFKSRTGQADLGMTREAGTEREPEDANSGGTPNARQHVGIFISFPRFYEPCPNSDLRCGQVRSGQHGVLADVNS